MTAILAAVLLAILATWVAQHLTRRFADPTERDEAEDHPSS
jgi:hypothetical protein